MWVLFSYAVASLMTTAEFRTLMNRRQSSAARLAVEQAIDILLPSATPAIGVRELNGQWTLEWSSQTADVNQFATSDSMMGGSCFQEIALSPDGRGRVENIATWSPRWRLIGGGVWEPSQAFTDGKLGWRAILGVDSAVLELGGYRRFDLSLSGFAKLIDRTKRQLSDAEGTGKELANDAVGRGWLECRLLDGGALRISRDNTGFLYEHSRVARADQEAPTRPRRASVQMCAVEAPMVPLRVLAYGDSLTAGTVAVDAPDELFPFAPHLEAALQEQATRAAPVVVRHRGLPGWTAVAMLRSVDDHAAGLCGILRRICDPPASLAIIIAGTNDLGCRASADEIVDALQGLHRAAHALNVPTLAVGLPPSAFQARDATAAATAGEVNTRLREWCASHPDVAFEPHPMGATYDPSSGCWSSDGLHLSPEGYRRTGEGLAEGVRQVLTLLSQR